MFGLFKKDPIKKLEGDYVKRLEQARNLQRKGDPKSFAERSAQADSWEQRPWTGRTDNLFNPPERCSLASQTNCFRSLTRGNAKTVDDLHSRSERSDEKEVAGHD